MATLNLLPHSGLHHRRRRVRPGAGRLRPRDLRAGHRGHGPRLLLRQLGQPVPRGPLRLADEPHQEQGPRQGTPRWEI